MESSSQLSILFDIHIMISNTLKIQENTDGCCRMGNLRGLWHFKLPHFCHISSWPSCWLHEGQLKMWQKKFPNIWEINPAATNSRPHYALAWADPALGPQTYWTLYTEWATRPQATGGFIIFPQPKNMNYWNEQEWQKLQKTSAVFMYSMELWNEFALKKLTEWVYV